MNTEERLTKLEARIAVLEDELQGLKKEVALIKGSKEVASTTANSIFCMSLDDINLSVRSYNCLKRAGINTVGELVALSEEELMRVRHLGKKSYKEAMEIIKELGGLDPEVRMQAKMQAEETRKKEKALCFEMSKKLLPALEVYARIRTKAKEEGILFSALGRYGHFPNWYRRGLICIKKILDEGKDIISATFLQQILNGEYPKMKELLDVETINLDLVKAVIIEDVAEATRYLDRQTNTYQELLKFLQLIQKYNE